MNNLPWVEKYRPSDLSNVLSQPHVTDTLKKFIEEGLIYKLPWGLEAIRVRAQANEDVVAGELNVNDYLTPNY